jgi:hypothetical protein
MFTLIESKQKVHKNNLPYGPARKHNYKEGSNKKNKQ